MKHYALLLISDEFIGGAQRVPLGYVFGNSMLKKLR